MLNSCIQNNKKKILINNIATILLFIKRKNNNKYKLNKTFLLTLKCRQQKIGEFLAEFKFCLKTNTNKQKRISKPTKSLKNVKLLKSIRQNQKRVFVFKLRTAGTACLESPRISSPFF